LSQFKKRRQCLVTADNEIIHRQLVESNGTISNLESSLQTSRDEISALQLEHETEINRLQAGLKITFFTEAYFFNQNFDLCQYQKFPFTGSHFQL